MKNYPLDFSTKWCKKINIKLNLFFILITFFQNPLCSQEEVINIPENYSFTIMGRILINNKPVKGVKILIFETDKDKYMDKVTLTFQFDLDGNVKNPTGITDSTGRFSIIADRRFWEKSGHFLISGGVIPGSSQNVGILQDSHHMPIVVKDDSINRKVDLGTIKISKK